MLTADHRELYPKTKLPSMTAETVTNRSELERTLEQVRHQGYAVAIGENEPDVAAVGAAVPGTRHALTVSVPRTRLDQRDVPRLGESLIRAARRVGEDLRH